MLALMTSRRVVMKNGGMVRVIDTSSEEQKVCEDLAKVDDWLMNLRETIRRGEVVGVAL